MRGVATLIFCLQAFSITCGPLACVDESPCQGHQRIEKFVWDLTSDQPCAPHHTFRIGHFRERGTGFITDRATATEEPSNHELNSQPAVRDSMPSEVGENDKSESVVSPQPHAAHAEPLALPTTTGERGADAPEGRPLPHAPARTESSAADNASKSDTPTQKPDSDVRRPAGAILQDQVVALAQTKADLLALADKQADVQQEYHAVTERIIPLEVKVQQAQETLSKAQKLIEEKAMLMASIQKNIRQYSWRPDSSVEAANASAYATLGELSSQITAMQAVLQPTQSELGDIKRELSQHMVRREALVTQLTACRERWHLILSPVHEHSTDKASYLKTAYGRHAEIVEAGLWHAWLLYFGGEKENASNVLNAVHRTLSSPMNIASVDSQWDFVYVSLVVDQREAAAARLVQFCKVWPKHPRLPHLQALAAMNEAKWSTAKSKFITALSRKGAEGDRLLNADAAWFFASAPIEKKINTKLVKDCIDRAGPDHDQGMCNLLRARAAVAATETEWGTAKELLAKAKVCAPRSVHMEIDTQAASYEAKQRFFVPSRARKLMPEQ